MITTEQRTQFKNVPITSYLAGLGLAPVLETGGEYVYFSPFHKEKTPSFFVNHARNLFMDFSNNVGGDVIKLVQLIDNVDFFGALKVLQKVDQDFEIELQKDLPASPQYQSFIKRITNLKSNALINYLTKERRIDIKIANRNLSEIHYFTSKGDFYSAGFANNSGGYELRNPHFKGCIGAKDLSYRGNADVPFVSIFEGFMDYLSFRTAHINDEYPNTFFIILNSLSLINRLPDLSKYATIFLYLDNDDSGKKATISLCEKYDNAANMSALVFPKHKDLNEFLIAKRV